MINSFRNAPKSTENEDEKKTLTQASSSISVCSSIDYETGTSEASSSASQNQQKSDDKPSNTLCDATTGQSEICAKTSTPIRSNSHAPSKTTSAPLFEIFRKNPSTAVAQSAHSQASSKQKSNSNSFASEQLSDMKNHTASDYINSLLKKYSHFK